MFVCVCVRACVRACERGRGQYKKGSGGLEGRNNSGATGF